VRQAGLRLPAVTLAAAAAAVAGLAGVGLACHWPLSVPLVAVARLLRWLVALLYVAVPVVALGALLARRVGPQDAASPGWRAALAWTLGWTAVVLCGTVALALGVYHDTIWSVGALLGNLVLLAWLLRVRWRPVLEAYAWLRSCWRRAQMGGVGSLWDLVLLVCAMGALALATLPPGTRDELAYHLALPQFWRFQHDWWVPPDNAHWLFPANAEVIWGYGMAAGGIHVPRLLTLAFGLATLALLTSWLKETGATAWMSRISLVFLLAAPMVLVLLGTCSVEWPMLFFLVLGWRASKVYLATGARRDLAMTALAWGLCLGFKYAVFPVVAGLALEWWVALARRRGLPQACAALGALVAGAAVFAGGWLARNWHLTGDPFYPLGGTLTGTAGAAARQADVLLNYSGLTGTWRFFPWLYHAAAESVLDQRLHLGWPILLVAVVLAGWRWAARLPWFTVVAVALLYLRFTPAPRAYVPVMMLAWLFLPEFLRALAQPSWARRVIAVLMLVLVLTSLPWFTVVLARTAPAAPADHVSGTSLARLSGSDNVQNYLLGNISDAELLRRDEIITPVIDWLRTRTPADARIWVWGGERTFYLERWARASSYLDRPLMLTWFEAYGAQGMTRKLVQEHLDFVLVDTVACPLPPVAIRTEAGTWPIPPSLQPVIAGWMRANLRELVHDHVYTLFLVLPAPEHEASAARAMILPGPTSGGRGR
jgi:hypothetical protein